MHYTSFSLVGEFVGLGRPAAQSKLPFMGLCRRAGCDWSTLIIHAASVNPRRPEFGDLTLELETRIWRRAIVKLKACDRKADQFRL